MPGSGLPTGCAQCQALKRMLEERELIYMNAKTRFNATGWRMDAGSFSRARAQVQDVRVDFEIAKIEFDQHRRKHAGLQSGSAVYQAADAKIVISRAALRMARASRRACSARSSSRNRSRSGPSE